jgi:hypothetical protein
VKEKVREILERELGRLDLLSRGEGLDLAGFKQLDLLIKCHASFVGNPTQPTTPDQSSPEASPVEALLEGLDISDDTSS